MALGSGSCPRTLSPGVPKPLTHKPESPSDDAADLHLVALLQAGESSAWPELIRRYQDRLFSVCLRMVHDRELAADLTQDAFIKVIQGIGTFDGRSKLSTWMIRVTMNVCLSKLRAEKLRRHASIERLRDGPSGDGSGRGMAFEQSREQGAAAGVEAHEDRERVAAALKELDPEQRAVLILADCRGLSYDHIADVLGVAVGTVKSRLFRARAALRDAVERRNGKA